MRKTSPSTPVHLCRCWLSPSDSRCSPASWPYLAPAWFAAKTDPADALRSGTRTTGAGATWLQRGLVVLQAAMSLVLLVGAGLFSQSLYKLQHTDLHLETTNRYIASTSIRKPRAYSATAIAGYALSHH